MLLRDLDFEAPELFIFGINEVSSTLVSVGKVSSCRVRRFRWSFSELFRFFFLVRFLISHIDVMALPVRRLLTIASVGTYRHWLMDIEEASGALIPDPVLCDTSRIRMKLAISLNEIHAGAYVYGASFVFLFL
jgi:hypothetical protein